MHSRHTQETQLPAWLWFFLALPMGLFVLLLYRGRRLPQLERLKARLPGTQRPRYSEPDSIPLNMSGEYGSLADVGAGAAGSQANGNTEIEEARMDFESPATANESSDLAAWQRTGQEPLAPRNLAHLRDENIQAEEMTSPQAANEADDLKRIEGIGPTIAGLLRDNGITTFRQLARTPTDRLVAILTQARLNRLSNPTTWAEQARLAAEGQWEALEVFQRTLKGGRRVE